MFEHHLTCTDTVTLIQTKNYSKIYIILFLKKKIKNKCGLLQLAVEINKWHWNFEMIF